MASNNTASRPPPSGAWYSAITNDSSSSLHVTVGIVGGSDLPKQEEQLGEGIVNLFPYNFSQNGLVAYKDGALQEVQTISKFLGEDNVKRIVNWTMRYLADIDIPIKVCCSACFCYVYTAFSIIERLLIPTLSDVMFFFYKRGTFIEFRSGMMNISPIGRNCSREERNDYEKIDLERGIRTDMVAAMKKEFADLDLTYSIGGQISFDLFPTGWDKTYCLRYLKEEDFDEIHFFGDKTFEGGNDFEIFTSERTIGHTVTSPEDTKDQCTKLFMS